MCHSLRRSLNWNRGDDISSAASGYVLTTCSCKCSKKYLFFLLLPQFFDASYFHSLFHHSHLKDFGTPTFTSNFVFQRIILNLVRCGELHFVVELVGVHREAEVSSPHAVLRLRPGKLLAGPFALLLLSFPPPVPPLFGTLGAELGGVGRALGAARPAAGLPVLNSRHGRRLQGERRVHRYNTILS